ncbi:MAG: cell wall hydrolase [Lachnospiraceae bacterium]|nr:cell wall hydrolase [Lachnospiraceae bacterium]
MRGIYSFLCGISEFIMNISKKTYRNCAIITTGICVVAVVAFASHQFGGAGKNSGYGGSGIVVYAADENDAERQNDIDELQELLEAQGEEQQQISSDDISEKQAMVVDVVMVADEQQVDEEDEALEEAEAPLVTVADSIVTTSGVPVEGVVKAPIELSYEDYNILLHIVAAESGICDVYGQMLVANVIFNRLNDKHFPDTIEEVVFQRNQFSPATYGTLWDAEVNATTIEAVNRVLAGEDYSCGALFFVAKKYVSEKTFNSFNTQYEWLFEHDGHDFFKFKES